MSIRGAAERERRDGRLLAIVSVGLGIAQLVFVRWAESRFPRRVAVAAEGAVFVVYIALVAWLLWRLERHRRARRHRR